MNHLDDALRHCIPWGVLIVDETCTIVVSNPRGRAILEARAGLEEVGGKVQAQRRNVDRLLRDLVRWAVQEINGQIDPPTGSNTLGIPGPGGGIRYAARIARCAHGQAARHALIVVADLSAPCHIDRAAAGRVFQLTDREAEFAELFASGHRLEAIAEAMGVATNTVRIHLRHVLAKAGCASQVELARKLAFIP
jgi:DNA-binding CsgD family transcriptional regulator